MAEFCRMSIHAPSGKLPLVVPKLLDMCLLTLFKNLNGSGYLDHLPEFVRKRLSLLLKQEPSFQENIRELNFSHCYSLVDEDVKAIGHLCLLQKLNFNHCEQLTGLALSSLSQLSKLEVLSISHCPKVSLGLCFLQHLPNLTELDASFCEVPDPVMSFISEISGLRSLNLLCNRLGNEGCTQLSKLTNLTYLNLSMNPLISDKTLESLSNLSHLTSLNLNFCKLITSNGIERLSNAIGTKLKHLDIIGCDRALTEVKQRPLILLAEDSKIQARMITMVLNRYNFDVEVASDGEMALEMFRSNPNYDLILMDVVMPVMDGISCVKRIREYENSMPELKRTPIIIQTADPRESQRMVCYEAGCDEFLTKPLDKASIILAKELMEEMNKNVLFSRSAIPNKNRKRRASVAFLPTSNSSSTAAAAAAAAAPYPHITTSTSSSTLLPSDTAMSQTGSSISISPMGSNSFSEPQAQYY